MSTPNDPKMIAACGLYCGACGKFKKGKCPGCAGNEKASWCTVRTCCKEKNIATCAECDEFSDCRQCAKHNNFISRMIGLVLRSNRSACIRRIKEVGPVAYAQEMSEKNMQSIKK